jgi:hypothetical protein
MERHQPSDGKPLSLRRLLISTAAMPVAALAIAATSPSAQAADIDWTLSGVTFNDGGVESGTFITNSLGLIQSWNITTTLGTSLPGTTYVGTNPGPDYSLANPNTFIVANTTTSIDLYRDGTLLYNGFEFSLTESNLVDPITIRNNAQEYSYAIGQARYIESGEATQVSTPEPSSLAIFAAALGLFGLKRRRARRR